MKSPTLNAEGKFDLTNRIIDVLETGTATDEQNRTLPISLYWIGLVSRFL
jgi:hypothetical protein